MDSDLHQVQREFSGLASADELILQRNLDMAAKAQRRADLVTLVSAVMPSVVPALLDFHLERQSKRLGRPSDGPYVNARQVFAVPDVVKEAAAISLEISEVALALIEERTK